MEKRQLVKVDNATENDVTCQTSLLTVLNNYVQAVNDMDETVMIPSKLKDMEISTNPEITVENNNKALLPTVTPGTDLFSFYRLLNVIKQEIITGPQSDDEEEEAQDGEPTDTSARKTAAAFRHHLRGLFNVMHQMTETAKYLTNRYETEVAQANKPTPFSFAL